jgi:hypothetical protein
MMSDDQLHRAWVAGVPIRTIARTSRTTFGVIAARIRKLRQQQGEDRWPHRPSPVARPRTFIRRAGAATLPTLASLR